MFTLTSTECSRHQLKSQPKTRRRTQHDAARNGTRCTTRPQCSVQCAVCSGHTSRCPTTRTRVRIWMWHVRTRRDRVSRAIRAMRRWRWRWRWQWHRQRWCTAPGSRGHYGQSGFCRQPASLDRVDREASAIIFPQYKHVFPYAGQFFLSWLI